MTRQEAERLAYELQRTPAICGWPFTKRDFIGAYMSMIKVGLDLYGQKICSAELRAVAQAMDVGKLTDAYARDEKQQSPAP